MVQGAELLFTVWEQKPSEDQSSAGVPAEACISHLKRIRVIGFRAMGLRAAVWNGRGT